MIDTLLVIEDDISFSDVLSLILTKNGFKVHVAHNAIIGLEKVNICKPDAVILDIMLPDLEGWHICAHLKEKSNMPIIMLTAFGSEDDVIRGLNLGADAYIIKPVTTQEIVARVRAVLRRIPDLKSQERSEHKRIFIHDNLVVDFDKGEVTVGRKAINLSPTEFHLLSVLIEYQGNMLSSEFLLGEVWGPEYIREKDYLQVYINYLRRKIETDPVEPGLIRDEGNVGYRFG
jgi:DNA-binding response OmpR family regulator